MPVATLGIAENAAFFRSRNGAGIRQAPDGGAEDGGSSPAKARNSGIVEAAIGRYTHFHTYCAVTRLLPLALSGAQTDFA